MKFIAVILAIVLSACAQQGTRADRLAMLDQIATKCQLPKSTFKLVGVDDLHFQPAPDSKFASVDCALGELKKSPFPMKMGFIGNEVYEPAEKVNAPK